MKLWSFFKHSDVVYYVVGILFLIFIPSIPMRIILGGGMICLGILMSFVERG